MANKEQGHPDQDAEREKQEKRHNADQLHERANAEALVYVNFVRQLLFLVELDPMVRNAIFAARF